MIPPLEILQPLVQMVQLATESPPVHNSEHSKHSQPESSYLDRVLTKVPSSFP